jgi:hypothetical protein
MDCVFKDLNRGLNWLCLTHGKYAAGGAATTRPSACAGADVALTDVPCPHCDSPLYLDPTAVKVTPDGEPVARFGNYAACTGCEFITEFFA